MSMSRISSKKNIFDMPLFLVSDKLKSYLIVDGLRSISKGPTEEKVY